MGLMQGSISVMQTSMANMESTLQGVQATLVQMQTSWNSIDANLSAISADVHFNLQCHCQPAWVHSVYKLAIRYDLSYIDGNPLAVCLLLSALAWQEQYWIPHSGTLSLITTQADGATGAASGAPTTGPAVVSISRLAPGPLSGHSPVAGSSAWVPRPSLSSTTRVPLLWKARHVIGSTIPDQMFVRIWLLIPPNSCIIH